MDRSNELSVTRRSRAQGRGSLLALGAPRPNPGPWGAAAWQCRPSDIVHAITNIIAWCCGKHHVERAVHLSADWRSCAFAAHGAAEKLVFCKGRAVPGPVGVISRRTVALAGLVGIDVAGWNVRLLHVS